MTDTQSPEAQEY